MAARATRPKNSACRFSAKYRSTSASANSPIQGIPVTAVDPDGEHAKIYRAIARQVKATLEKGRARAAPRITIE